MGDDKAQLKVTFDISTMNEGSKEEKALEHTKATNYTSEEARNAYNSLLLRNGTAKQDVNAYAKHLQEKDLYKLTQEQQSTGAKMTRNAPLGTVLTPEFIIQEASALRQPLTFSNLKSCFNRYPNEETEEKPKQLV